MNASSYASLLSDLKILCSITKPSLLSAHEPLKSKAITSATSYKNTGQSRTIIWNRLTINQAINQSTNQSTNQPINQSINQNAAEQDLLGC